MTTWASTFDEAAGTVVQDCGGDASYWINTASPTFWWRTTGNGYLSPDTGTTYASSNMLYHDAVSADQSISIRFERTSNMSRPPQISLRSTQDTNASTLLAPDRYVMYYSSGEWRIYYGYARVGQVADPDYADGVDDPAGDEVRQIDFDFVGDTLSLTITKGLGAVVGHITVEDAYGVAGPGNIAVVLAGAYTSVGDISSFGRLDAMTAEDGGGAVVYDVSAVIAGTLDGIIGSAPAAVSNPATAGIIGTLDGISGEVGATAANQVSASASGSLADIVGAAAVSVTEDGAVNISGTIGDITGAAESGVANPTSAVAAGQVGDIVGTAAVSVYPDGLSEVVASSTIAFDRDISTKITFNRVLDSAITFELGG